MSVTQIRKEIANLSEDDQASIAEWIEARLEGLSVEDYRRLNFSLDEALAQSEKGKTLEEVRGLMNQWIAEFTSQN